MRRGLRAEAGGVDRVGAAVDDRLVKGVLHEGLRFGTP
jgi:hypothetical protein